MWFLTVIGYSGQTLILHIRNNNLRRKSEHNIGKENLFEIKIIALSSTML